MCVLAVPPSSAAADDVRARLPGVVPAWAQGSPAVAEVPPGSMIAISLVLPWRNRGALDRLVRRASDPASPDYQSYLTPERFRSGYAPDRGDIAVVVGWLRSAGLEVGRLPTNGLYVPARGSAARMQQVFHVRLLLYRVRGTLRQAPDRAPTVPLEVSRRVIGVRGLVDEPIAVPDPLPVAAPDEPATPVDSAPPAAVVYASPCSKHDGDTVQRSLPPVDGRWQPAVTCATSIAEQRAAYGVDRLQGVDGRGQTVVIVGSHGIQTLPGDVAEWSRRQGLPPLRPGQLQQLTYPGAYQTPAAEPYLRPQVWALQSHMLVENIRAMAPGANIVYLGTPSSLDLPNGTTLAVDGGLGDVVMNGWYTLGENTNPASIAQINQTAQQAAATGISLLFASGSLGDNTAQGAAAGPEYPANDPLVTAVGATSLVVRSGSIREVGWAKTVAKLTDGRWVDDPRTTFRGSGGGTSKVNAQPDYQRGMVPDRLARRPNGTRGRAVPDVAVNGDAETGILIGMTQRFPDGRDHYAERRIASDESATAVFAALVTLANQAGGKNLGFLNPALYALRTRSATAFRDIVPDRHLAARVRSDYVDGATPRQGVRPVLKTFEAYDGNLPATGYDVSTGLGSPSRSLVAQLSGR
jgi:subtilase family serine protease